MITNYKCRMFWFCSTSFKYFFISNKPSVFSKNSFFNVVSEEASIEIDSKIGEKHKLSLLNHRLDYGL